MRSIHTVLLVGLALISSISSRPLDLPTVNANPNVERAGTIRDGVLTIALEATQSSWHPNGDDKPAQSMAAFAEEGKAPLNPGPLIRAPRGTEIRISVHNTLSTPITFFLPSAIRGEAAAGAADSVVIAEGAVGIMSMRATTPGNYVYRAMRPATPRPVRVTGLLAGGVVIDGESTLRADRVFVMTEAAALFPGDSANRTVFMINGLSWPNTERIAATTGDSLHWRVINASPEIHPMHLHGFYFRVDDFSPSSPDRTVRGIPNRLVVTERMPQLSGMSVSWQAERAGNWIFHCHFAIHMMPDMLKGDHVMTGMGGLVLGVNIAPRVGARALVSPVPKRRLRLTAIADPSNPGMAQSMRFVLDERGRKTEAGAGFSPTIELTRGEPIAITVINTLTEPTAVHWHGIELESYNDGVPGVSGSGAHLAPIIAPRDSFVVRFTPPRAGTFIYHSHVNEVTQQAAGLAGALIVHEPGAVRPPDDHVFLLKGSRLQNPLIPLDINGQANPDTIVLRVGKPARLRFISLATVVPNATFSLTTRADSSFANLNDTKIVQWRPLAKDGADLPAPEQVSRLARQVVSMGETYDFEFTPTERGLMRIEARIYDATGTLLARVPIRVQ